MRNFEGFELHSTSQDQRRGVVAMRLPLIVFMALLSWTPISHTRVPFRHATMYWLSQSYRGIFYTM